MWVIVSESDRGNDIVQVGGLLAAKIDLKSMSHHSLS